MAAMSDDRRGVDLDEAMRECTKAHEDDVTVRQVDGSSEEGVFAVRRFEQGQTVWSHRPLFVSVDPSSQLASLACDHCGRYLGPVERQLAYMVREQQEARGPPAVFDSAAGLPPLAALDTDYVECCATGCPSVYCSEACRGAAWQQYHCLLCPRGGDADPQPADVFFNQAVCVNDNFALVAKIAASLIVRQQTAAEYLKRFCHGLWWQVFSPPDNEHDHDHDHDDDDDDDEKRDGSGPSEAELQQICTESYYLFTLMVTPNLLDGQHITVSLEDYAQLAGMVERNAAECKITSPLDDYFRQHAAELAANTSLLMAAVRAQYPIDHDDDDDDDDDDDEFEWPPLKVAVFCPLTSKLNHSCAPNTELVRSGPGALSVLEALSDIEAGAELHIAYIDTDIDVHERQQILCKPYMFVCACSRCRDEA